jgi:Tfp pilus assembly protein PilV
MTSLRFRRARRASSLIELLAAVLVISTAVLSLLAALWAGSQSAAVARGDATAETAAAAIASDIQLASYTNCASSYPVDSTLVPAGYNATATVTYWNSQRAPAGFTASCTTDAGLQQVVVTVTANGGISATSTTAKRR